MAPGGQDPKDEKAEEGRLKECTGVLPDREEVVRGDVNKDAMQVRHHGREPVTKGTDEDEG